MSIGLKNKTVTVTGGRSAIGRETAIAFAKEGCNIVVGDIDLDIARKVVGEIQEKEQVAIAVQTTPSSAFCIRLPTPAPFQFCERKTCISCKIHIRWSIIMTTPHITGVTLPVDCGFVANSGWEAYGGYER